MKILLLSHFFHPSVGGIEEVSMILAREFVRAGHEVQVVTCTKAQDGAEFSFPVHRRPGPLELLGNKVGKSLRAVTICDGIDGMHATPAGCVDYHGSGVILGQFRAQPARLPQGRRPDGIM